MAEPSSLPPAWLEAARSAARDLGFGTDLAGLSPERWAQVSAAAGDTMAARGTVPPDWAAELARQAGRPDGGELARDEADAKLAAEGEVFGIEDDA
ncbi:hypothetical protein Q8W71_00150 [Methylobacterium sp. NEAU 140]|uniref:hypothetical protein n=1 Tax=Methylobacterium sp. NEAU 140 TaxID=3064945 RepID=UPI0027351280|nr:hypothetical protein [Methylobacterium sp. NEAU 140]MDP4021020.1 hypothetical protein [Methylobacterium sp. NEAU 140]